VCRQQRRSRQTRFCTSPPATYWVLGKHKTRNVTAATCGDSKPSPPKARAATAALDAAQKSGGGGAWLVDTTETLRAAGPLRRQSCGASRRIRQRPARCAPGGAWVAPAHAMCVWREPRRAEGSRAKCARSNFCCCTAAAPWISRSASHHFTTASSLLALSVAEGVVGAVDLVWLRQGRRARPLGGGVRSVLGHRLSFFFCMLVHGSRLLRGRGRHLGGGSHRHAAAQDMGRPCGASAGDPSWHHGGVRDSSGRGSRAGCSVAVAGPQMKRRFGDRLAPLRRRNRGL